MNPLQPILEIFNYVFFEPVYNILMVLYAGIHTFLPAGGFALSIVVLTLILRTCLIPLTRKQLKSSRAMQELQPRLKELQARYKNNPQELMAAQQALYKEHGVNPVSGCLPLVIQLPFIYALYGALNTVLRPNTGETAANHLIRINNDLYPFIPHLTHLPDTAFFWANLASPDPLHILPVVAAALTFLQLRMAMPVRKPVPAGQRDSMTQATSMMQYVMPVMTLFIGWAFPAGLALYWCITTLFSAVQQYFLTGLGSLFVGIPGMEHLVPEPKQITAPTPPRSLPAGSARALTAPTPPSEPGTGGLRGMLRQLREQMSAAQQNALETQKARQNGTAPTGAQNAARTATDSTSDTGEGFADAPKPAAPRRDRPRQQKTGPVLVKPPTTANTANGTTPAKSATESGSSGELPEVAIARDASGPAPFAGEPLPEEKIASLAANGNGNGKGTSGKNGSSASPSPRRERGPGGEVSGKNGNVPAVSGARSGAGTSSGRPSSAASNRPGGQRKPSGNTGNKGSQSGRPRSGRPKGGR